MFAIIDREKDFQPIKSGFKTAAQANRWAKKHLHRDNVYLWGEKVVPFEIRRYSIRMIVR